MGETGFCNNLRKSAVSCENLRFPAVSAQICDSQILDLQSEPKISKNLRSGSGFSLLLSPFWRALLCHQDEVLQSNYSKISLPCNSLNHKRIRVLYFSGNSHQINTYMSGGRNLLPKFMPTSFSGVYLVF